MIIHITKQDVYTSESALYNVELSQTGRLTKTGMELANSQWLIILLFS
jgi:hypothetical protein